MDAKEKILHKKNNFIKVKKNLSLGKNFYCEHGNIYALDNLSVGSNCRFFDKGNIYIGENVFIDSNVTLRTKPSKPIYIYNGVRIGSCSIILPGVVINNNSIVVPGSIVVKSVPANVIVAGCPAKIVKRIRTNKTREKYLLKEYTSDK
ncbi:MAG: hypothetical protein PHS54_04960 [Clostridia bacterium]|nr:hypothetical protein [Clostridia bacterium]